MAEITLKLLSSGMVTVTQVVSVKTFDSVKLLVKSTQVKGQVWVNHEYKQAFQNIVIYFLK